MAKKKVIKFFTVDKNKKLRPFYFGTDVYDEDAARDQILEDTSIDEEERNKRLQELAIRLSKDYANHPNLTSEIGREQTFEPDPASTYRQAFSTIALRDPSTIDLFNDLFDNSRLSKNQKPYIVEVDEDDEYIEPNPEEHLDAPSEKLFKKIKPVSELKIPKEIKNYDKYAKKKSIIGIDPWRFGSNLVDLQLIRQHKDKLNRIYELLGGEYITGQEEGTTSNYEEYSKLRDDFEIPGSVQMFTNMNEVNEFEDTVKQQVKEAYKKLRQFYTPQQIYNATRVVDDDDERKYDSDKINKLFYGDEYKSKYELISNFIKELEKDDDFISDLRTKNIISSINRKY